jgi:hypothetical protein
MKDKPYYLRSEKCSALLWSGDGYWTESEKKALRFRTKFEARREQELLKRIAQAQSTIVYEG